MFTRKFILRARISNVVFSDDGKTFVMVDDRQELRVWKQELEWKEVWRGS